MMYSESCRDETTNKTGHQMKARLRTRQTEANTAALRWREQYRMYPQSRWKPTLDKLMALGATPNPDDVDRIVGNNTWTSVGDCNGCGKSPDVVVVVGERVDWESNTCQLCIKCAREAVRAFKDVK